jgi:hypothetical protein
MTTCVSQIRGESTPREATNVLNDGLEMKELSDGSASQILPNTVV